MGLSAMETPRFCRTSPEIMTRNGVRWVYVGSPDDFEDPVELTPEGICIARPIRSMHQKTGGHDGG